MNKLVHSLVNPILEEYSNGIALIPGGFKPPTLGHFYLVEEISKRNEIDKIIIIVGPKERDNITQEQSIAIWNIYKKHLSPKVEIQKSSSPSPVKDVLNIIKLNPQDFFFPVVGIRGEEDEKDLARFKPLEGKYENFKPIVFQSPLKISGTQSRQALNSRDFISFQKYIPIELSPEERQQVWSILTNQNLNENSTYSQYIDIKKEIAKLTKYMLDKGMNIQPLPKLIFKNGDSENAREFLGKTAYYDPKTQTIVLYTEGRHPKDIARSFTHEIIHHIQNLENRLGNITTTNTQEDDALNDIEAEANLKGTMTFRNWTDSLQESFYLDIPKFNQPKTIQQYLIESINEISLSKENAAKINGDLTGGTFTVGDITYEYSIKNIPNPYKDLGLFYNIQFTPSGEVTSIPKGGKENYIKILSTMYKIILDFIEKEQPTYVGISSLDNSGDKNYHTVYNRLTSNHMDLIPGYFRKDSNLTFDSPQGKGRFIVLKKKDDLNEKKNKDPFGLNAYAMELGRLREE